MSNVLSEEKKQQIIALGKLGWSLRRIERFTGVRRETAGAYLKAAGIVVQPPGAWRMQAPAKPAIEVTPDSEAKPATVTPDLTAPFSENQGCPADASPSSASTCEPYRELIEQGLSRGRNAKAIWQDLVSDHGFAGSYQTVKRFVRKIRGSQLPQAVGIILTTPGEEGQADYGSGPMVRHPQSGKYRRTRLFVLTLGYSRKSVRLLTWRSSARIWAELHEKALRRLGGCPRVVVLDNLAQPHEKLSLRFGGLLNDAIAKNLAHPLVVFIDTNLPYKAAERVLGRHPLAPYRLSNIMTALLDRDRKEHGGVDRYAMLVFTNHPHHYVATDELDPQGHVVGVMPDPPKVELAGTAPGGRLVRKHPKGFSAVRIVDGLALRNHRQRSRRARNI